MKRLSPTRTISPFLLVAVLLVVNMVPRVMGDPHLHHWEQASRDPDRLVLTWPGDPATAAAVSWRTNSEVNQAWAEIALSIPEPRFDLAAKRLPATTVAVDQQLESSNKQSMVHYHTVVFEGLEPETKYVYRVGDGVDHWSEWVQFDTASDMAKPFKFVYFGDAQNGVLSHWSRVIRAAQSHAPNARFFLHAGDLINQAHRDQEWAEWFKAGGWIHSSTPSVVVTGNHEYQRFSGNDGGEKVLSMFWRPQFNLPTYGSLPAQLQETVYYYDIQGVRLIILNTNRLTEQQVDWLDQRLEENPNPWTIVSYHHPMFSSGRDRDNKRQREIWKPVFDKHQVDLVLQGHDHTYARGHIPVSAHEKAQNNEIQTMYVNSVSGMKMYDFVDSGWDIYAPYGAVLDRRAENGQFFQVIEVDSNQLTYQAFTANGLLYDAFELTKNTQGEKTLRRLPIDLEQEFRFENTAPYTR